MFQVFDNNKPADTTGYPEMHHSWAKSVFVSWGEAIAYANNWLGIYGPLPKNFKLGDSYNYGGGTIEIRPKKIDISFQGISIQQ